MSKILLVEDDMEISTMLKNFLTTEKFEVITAYDGKSALDRFFSDSFSLVLLDLMIPQISGIEVMEKIRENSTVPIIIISAKDTDSDKTLGLGLGADDYNETVFRHRSIGKDKSKHPKNYTVCCKCHRTAANTSNGKPCHESE